jgi:hypothetical protein
MRAADSPACARERKAAHGKKKGLAQRKNERRKEKTN